jgi:predicted nucleotide-binding protein (sugar kinase/HSP70/actin superfamily)
MKIGIPRALLYYYYEDLWLNFFENLGIETIVSPQSNKEIVKIGLANSIDEGCFSSKVFVGHIAYLLDKCDRIFIPRIENTGIRSEYCTRIFGVYDLAKSTFPHADILSANVNYLFRKKEPDAFVEIGQALGKTAEESLEAYQDALAVANEVKDKKIAEQNELLDTDDLKVMVFSHKYNAFDASIGKDAIDFFETQGIRVIYADLIDEKEARKIVKDDYDNRVYWKVTSELLGGLEKYRDRVDGIVLISTFPCGPDSLFNELVIRRTKDKPILSLVIDELDATAGIQTRLESFLDIIMTKREVRS